MRIVQIENNVVVGIHSIGEGVTISSLNNVEIVEIQDNTDVGIGYAYEIVDGVSTFTKPPHIPVISFDIVRSNLTLTEKVKWDAITPEPEIVTAKLEFATPLTVEQATPVLQLLVDSNLIGSNSKKSILAAAI